MANQRDEFPIQIKRILAERVSYKCSNPNCQKSTIGPAEVAAKSVSIGVAAHITAASVGGPRYNPLLSSAERADINNGIWLCVSCSVLIDKDILRHNVELLEEWKSNAEERSRALLNKSASNSGRRPKVHCALIWKAAESVNLGYITNQINQEKFINDDIQIYCLAKWYYSFVIINNSSSPVFNVKIMQSGNYELKIKNTMSAFNNLAPLAEIKLDCQLETYYMILPVDRGIKDKIADRYPPELTSIKIELSYEDESEYKLKTIMTYIGGEPLNYFL